MIISIVKKINNKTNITIRVRKPQKLQKMLHMTVMNRYLKKKNGM